MFVTSDAVMAAIKIIVIAPRQNYRLIGGRADDVAESEKA